MRILLTGATGFVGGAVGRRALARGHEVAALVRSPGRELEPWLQSPGIRIVRGALASPPWEEIRSLALDACVHCAWIATPGVYLESPENEVLLAQSRAFVTGVARSGVGRLLALGTCAEYGFTGQPLREEDPIDPRSAYARCKNELRLWIEQESGRLGLSSCWARIFYPYGPGEHPGRFPSWVIQKLRRLEPVAPKTPDSVKDYVFIDDLAEAIVLLLESSSAGQVNVGSGTGVTVRELAGTVGRLMKCESLIGDPAKTENDPFPHHVAEVNRLKSLGWLARTGLEEGLARLLSARSIPPCNPSALPTRF